MTMFGPQMPEGPIESARSFPSPLRRLRKRWVTKLERLSSPRKPQSPLSSTQPSQHKEPPATILNHHEWAMHANKLRRVEAVQVLLSIRKPHRHFFIIHVYLRSTRLPLHKRDPDYQLTYSSECLFALRETIYESSQSHALDCKCCQDCNAFLVEQYEPMNALTRKSCGATEKQERLEHVIHRIVRLVLDSTPEHSSCPGCHETIRSLASFFRRQYEQSTGVM